MERLRPFWFDAMLFSGVAFLLLLFTSWMGPN